MLMVISKMYPFNFTSHDFIPIASIAASVITGLYATHYFKTVYEEKKLFGNFYKYKGNIKQLIEDYNQAGEDDNTLDNKNIIKRLIKDNPYNIQNVYDWEKNSCGETFLINFIKSVFSEKSTERINKYKSFFLGNYETFNNHIDKTINTSWSQDRHVWFTKHFPLNEAIELVNEDGQKTNITLSIGTYYTYEDIEKSMPGKIISNDNITENISEQFSLITKIMAQPGNKAIWNFPMNILAGPPGTGKTIRIKDLFLSLSQDMTNKKKCFYIELKPAHILNKWVGGSEGNLNLFFEQMKKIGQTIKDDGFVLIHMDEIESLLARRDKEDQKEWSKNIVNGFLQGIDQLRSSGFPVLILGTTNYEEQIDDAAKRSGRLEILHIKKPNEEEKKNILNFYENYFRGQVYNIQLTEEEKADILSNNETGADIRSAIQKIFLEKLKKNYDSCLEEKNEK